jgi:hypothetical protein
MKAKIIKPGQFNAMQPNNKETVNTLQVVTIVKGEIKEVITARFYMGRSSQASVVYCCLWVGGVCSGKGNAGGYGYHKESAALDEAITSAGIELYGSPYTSGTPKTRPYNDEKIDYKRRASINGCGSTAMVDALTDIARDILGHRKVKVL